MRYSLRTLLLVMLLGGPALAILWWLQHTWSVQVLAILLLMLAALALTCGLVTAAERLLRLLFSLQRSEIGGQRSETRSQRSKATKSVEA
jgi:hypothetical protein